ncbi:MAG: hypothetical protein KJ984_01810, partial [Nanoarchaeota archaeon]|nr:hypothetical protein [Nanoarchaeota archaeon]
KKSSFKIISFFLVLSLLIGSALAQDDVEALFEEASKDLVGQEIPGVLGKVFGNEQINFNIKKENEEVFIAGLVLENKKIKSFSLGTVEDPSLNVYIEEATLMELQSAENPVPILKKAVDEGKVTYKAVGLINKIKFSFLFAFSKIISLLTLDEEGDFEELPEAGSLKTEEKETVVEKNDKAPEELKPTEEETKKESSEENKLTGNIVQEAKTPAITNKINEPKAYVVEMKVTGFEPNKLTIKVGDTVVWKNVRGNDVIKKSFLLGAQACVKIKSPFMEPEDTFSWTFDKAVKCNFVDGIITTLTSQITVVD